MDFLRFFCIAKRIVKIYLYFESILFQKSIRISILFLNKTCTAILFLKSICIAIPSLSNVSRNSWKYPHFYIMQYFFLYRFKSLSYYYVHSYSGNEINRCKEKGGVLSSSLKTYVCLPANNLAMMNVLPST